MKVAIVYDFFPHYRGAVMTCLDRHGRHDYVFFGAPSSLRGSIRVMDVSQLQDFRPTPARYLLKQQLLVQRGLLPMCLDRSFDAVIFLANPYFLTTWLAAAVARLSGKRVLFWTHGWLQRERGIKSWIRRTFYRLAHALLLYGDRAKSIGEEEGFSADRLYPIYNSLDFKAQVAARQRVSHADVAEMRQSWFGETATPVVVCCARLIPNCRFDLLIDALALLLERGTRVNLLLIGDGPERANLESRAKASGVKAVFAGECYDEELLCRWTMAADVTVSPGKVGLTAMQSFAFGVPVIAHNDFETQMPEAEAIRPGINGDFFRKNDVADLARVIDAWISRGMPREAVAEACVNSLIPKYTPEGQVVEIERAIDGQGPSAAWLHETHFNN